MNVKWLYALDSNNDDDNDDTTSQTSSLVSI